jgi:hypothetical protein
MSETNNVDTTVTKEEINIDELFGADNVTLPEDTKPKMMDPIRPAVDMTFDQPLEEEDLIDEEGAVSPESITKDTAEDIKAKGDNIIDAIDVDPEDEEDLEKPETRGRKPITGMTDLISSLVKKEKLFAFDDEGKSLDDYSAKDFEELIEANLEEARADVRRETPKQFFDALPNELKVAARYVADGGTDLKSLFKTLGQAEDTYDLDPTTERGQEQIIMEYLSSTDYGTPEEINEEIEIWKDLGKLEQQAAKFKPKLDKAQEKIVARKLQEQQLKQEQQAHASKQYMSNVYNTLKDGKIGDLTVDKKTQSMLYNGLVQPAYPSVSGKNTNLLGHLLEKYQFQEPNYPLITEALWLLSDPNGYKNKIMEKGAQANIAKTVRKLKTEQSNKTSGSLGVQEAEKETSRSRGNSKKKLSRPQNIFKRI